MQRKFPAGVLVVAVAAALLLAAPGVRAAAVQVSFTATTQILFRGVPEKAWTDDEGILHIRGRLVVHAVTGDVVGTTYSVQNLNIDPATGSGDGYGNASQHFTWNGLTGTFEGRWSATFSAGNVVVTGVGQGTGGFEGMKIAYTAQFPAGSAVGHTEGTILIPQG